MKMSTAIIVCLCLKLFKGCVCLVYSGINQKQLFVVVENFNDFEELPDFFLE